MELECTRWGKKFAVYKVSEKTWHILKISMKKTDTPIESGLLHVIQYVLKLVSVPKVSKFPPFFSKDCD